MLTTTNTIIKSTPAHTVQNHWSYQIESSNSSSVRRQGYFSNYPGGQTIEYERGPKYIDIGGARCSNWKQCEHVQEDYWTGHQSSFSISKQGIGAWPGWYQNASIFNVDVPASTSIFDMSVPYITMPPDDSESIWDTVFSDIAGRTKEYLLSLEDLAGLFGGKSMWTSIRSVGSAFNMLAKSIGHCKKLGRAFGYKRSLYDMWLSSKETVRQIVGLRLGYRFSFKTTLNDISEAIGFSADFSRFAQNIIKRNSSEFLKYSKRSSQENVDSIQVISANNLYGNLMNRVNAEFRSVMFPNLRYLKNPSDLPNATIKKYARRETECFVKARVRYPSDYAGLAHYYQGKYGLDKPLTTLWAIVPLSFVVDYLFNVQDALTFVDNKLNDYLVSTTIGSAWMCQTLLRAAQLTIPATILRFAQERNDYGGPTWKGDAIWPGIRATHFLAKRFDRVPGSTGRVRAQLPPLIGASNNNWVRSVGTGLELLSQTRLR